MGWQGSAKHRCGSGMKTAGPQSQSSSNTACNTNVIVCRFRCSAVMEAVETHEQAQGHVEGLGW